MCNSRTGKINPWQKNISIVVNSERMGMGINWKGKRGKFGGLMVLYLIEVWVTQQLTFMICAFHYIYLTSKERHLQTNIVLYLIISLLKHLGGSLIIPVVFFEMHTYKKHTQIK